METVETLARWRTFAHEARSAGKTVGLVATMGALHAGHESLMRIAREQSDVVIVTIFVNPRQFNDGSDLSAYPRTLESDSALCQSAGVDLLVVPTLDEMWPKYPNETSTTVNVTGVGDGLESDGRPGHFAGVASVVAKLFNVTGPCRAYFGEKDYQQLAVVRRMVDDLAFDIEVVGCPIIRDVDGLALSSRNVRLSETGRQRALGFSRSLRALNDGTPRVASDVRLVVQQVLNEHEIDVEYAEVVNPTTLRPLSDDDHGVARVLLAGVVDGVRLLDNADVTLQSTKEYSSATGH